MHCNSEDYINMMTLIFEFTDEEIDALHGFIPMTQELFNSCMNRCMKLGSRADKIFFKLLDTYPEFMIVYHDTLPDFF